jgi:hypothetical protein
MLKKLCLGADRQGKLALWQVIARIIDQGSRLSAVRLATTHAACDLLQLDAFNEEDLYSNLAWLSEKQSHIETQLFERLYLNQRPALFLYDVTSSYLEGTQNQLAAFGYNRDGKKSKMQIIIGLLCDQAGRALAIEVAARQSRQRQPLEGGDGKDLVPSSGSYGAQTQPGRYRFCAGKNHGLAYEVWQYTAPTPPRACRAVQ